MIKYFCRTGQWANSIPSRQQAPVLVYSNKFFTVLSQQGNICGSAELRIEGEVQRPSVQKSLGLKHILM